MNAPIQPPSKKNLLKKILIRLGLLMAFLFIVLLIVTPTTTNIFENGQIEIAKTFVTGEADTAMLAYKLNTGDYPTAQQGLKALISPPEGVKGWKGPYFASATTIIDPWGHVYHYAYPSTHGQPAGKYDCWSLGPDGKDGTADDIGNWNLK